MELSAACALCQRPRAVKFFPGSGPSIRLEGKVSSFEHPIGLDRFFKGWNQIQHDPARSPEPKIAFARSTMAIDLSRGQDSTSRSESSRHQCYEPLRDPAAVPTLLQDLCCTYGKHKNLRPGVRCLEPTLLPRPKSTIPDASLSTQVRRAVQAQENAGALGWRLTEEEA